MEDAQVPERLADADMVATPCSTSDAAAGDDVRMEVAISKGSKKTNTQVSRNVTDRSADTLKKALHQHAVCLRSVLEQAWNRD